VRERFFTPRLRVAELRRAERVAGRPLHRLRQGAHAPRADRLHDLAGLRGGAQDERNGDIRPSDTSHIVRERGEFFYGRRWPEGYSFPACEACNRDSKVSEAIAAVISRCFPDPRDAKETDELRRQVEGIRNNDPRRRQKARADALHDADTCYVSRTAYPQFRPFDPPWVPTAV
jgi:hypothetical protein